MRHNKCSFKREVYSDTSLPIEMRKISKKQPNLISKKKKIFKANKAPSEEGNNTNHSVNKIKIK